MIYAGTVIKVEEALDGSPMYTVATPNGAVYFPCFVSSSSGGFDAKYMMSPVSEGAEVVISSVNRGKVYYIIGGIPDNVDQVAVSTSAQTSLNMDADYNGHHHTETVLRNTNSTINLSPVHDLTLKSPNMRLQLDEGVLRISQQGTSENYILNGQPFLNELFEYIVEMEARINLLSSVVNIMIPSTKVDLITETTALVALQTAGTATPSDLNRLLVEIPAETVTLTTGQVALSTNISSSAVAKSDCESTQNTFIKIP
jgi:hypothetical protein